MKKFPHVLCSNARELSIVSEGVHSANEAIFDDIYLDYNDINEINTHMNALFGAI